MSSSHVVSSYAALRDEISHIRQTVQLNLFGLSCQVRCRLQHCLNITNVPCQELNTEMFTRTENLRLGLIKFQVVASD